MQTQTVNQLSEETIQAIQRMYGDAQQSIKALEWMAENGFEPVSIHVGRSIKPLIRIENSSLCMRLKREFNAYYYMMRPSPKGRELVWRADILSCLIEWAED